VRALELEKQKLHDKWLKVAAKLKLEEKNKTKQNMALQ